VGTRSRKDPEKGKEAAAPPNIKEIQEIQGGQEALVQSPSSREHQKQGVCHTMALAFTLKRYLMAKEELWKFKYFTTRKYNLKKKSSKTNQNPSRYHNSMTNFKFQHKPKYHLSRILL
jgi:hypothetical protein